jgi:hypothetical protein
MLQHQQKEKPIIALNRAATQRRLAISSLQQRLLPISKPRKLLIPAQAAQ